MSMFTYCPSSTDRCDTVPHEEFVERSILQEEIAAHEGCEADCITSCFYQNLILPDLTETAVRLGGRSIYPHNLRNIRHRDLIPKDHFRPDMQYPRKFLDMPGFARSAFVALQE